MRLAATLVGLGLLVATATPAAAEPHRKSHETAKLLSGLGAGVSTALVLSAFLIQDPHDPYNKPLLYSGLGVSLVGPSAGEYYAGQYLTIGEGVRAAAVALALVGVTRTEHVSCLAGVDDNSCTSIEGKGVAFLGVAAIAYIGGMFYDVYDAPDAVDRYNYKLRMQLVPGPMPSSFGGAPGAGVWLRGSF